MDGLSFLRNLVGDVTGSQFVEKILPHIKNGIISVEELLSIPEVAPMLTDSHIQELIEGQEKARRVRGLEGKESVGRRIELKEQPPMNPSRIGLSQETKIEQTPSKIKKTNKLRKAVEDFETKEQERKNRISNPRDIFRRIASEQRTPSTSETRREEFIIQNPIIPPQNPSRGLRNTIRRAGGAIGSIAGQHYLETHRPFQPSRIGLTQETKVGDPEFIPGQQPRIPINTGKGTEPTADHVDAIPDEVGTVEPIKGDTPLGGFTAEKLTIPSNGKNSVSLQKQPKSGTLRPFFDVATDKTNGGLPPIPTTEELIMETIEWNYYENKAVLEANREGINLSNSKAKQDMSNPLWVGNMVSDHIRFRDSDTNDYANIGIEDRYYKSIAPPKHYKTGQINQSTEVQMDKFTTGMDSFAKGDILTGYSGNSKYMFMKNYNGDNPDDIPSIESRNYWYDKFGNTDNKSRKVQQHDLFIQADTDRGSNDPFNGMTNIIAQDENSLWEQSIYSSNF